MTGTLGTDKYGPEGWDIVIETLEVAGLRFHIDNVTQWVDAVSKSERKTLPYGLELSPEPENPHDPNAIRIIGCAMVKPMFGKAEMQRWHIGYVDAEHAEIINRDYLGKTPLAAILNEIYIDDENIIEVEFDIACDPSGTYRRK
ncbi:hypothetical protein Q1W73_16610 [Asticcacaulis sp. ZE23SCel15]|uniref:hypothetical protein n=1 Tax=Asticcacaulis sp. ZE23SCel15 TaxID=3059027 RepID=UPI00265F12AC|nr:hypothetical protein [Asticcacaulis sp. ZE23SCel15]WKL57266.1 hypothetical protein Q1W73_16610 [Asticcacaulis sp. ZE23SCel15]